MAGRSNRLLVTLLALGQMAQAGASLATDGQNAVAPALLPGESSLPLDEVTVIGKKLYQIRRELIDAQDRFYLAYNELNTQDDFDIHCTVYAPLGTLIKRRDCRIEFLQQATSQESQNLFLGLTSDPPTPSRVGMSAQMLWFARRDEYRQSIKALIEAHPELQELALKWQQLQQQYDKARKERHKDRRALFE